MTDSELLQKAAMVAGPEVFGEPGCWFRRISENHSMVTGWNPLTDDGDALRLAVALGLVVDCSRPSAALPFAQHAIWLDETMSTQELTRRAIVRAAAALADLSHSQGTEP